MTVFCFPFIATESYYQSTNIMYLGGDSCIAFSPFPVVFSLAGTPFQCIIAHLASFCWSYRESSLCVTSYQC